jgi:hemerythrin-like domain-containing protein
MTSQPRRRRRERTPAGQSDPDLRLSYLEHNAMRSDAARLVELVTAARPADESRLVAVSRYYANYEGAIHDHHRSEDMVIYPALMARDTTFADAEGELEGEHVVLADRLAVVRESLNGLSAAAGASRWEREHDEATKAAAALQRILDEHIGHEEAVAFPRYRASFTKAEYADLGKAAWKLVGQRAVIFAGPWVLEHATPGQRTQILSEQPLLMRLLYRVALQPRYARLAAPLHASRDHAGPAEGD